MASASTHFKLGLFTLLGILAALAAMFGLGVRGVRADSVSYHTYFDESVQGLEIGAPVKYRGVLIGSVSDVRIAPGRKLVDVTLSLDAAEVEGLHLAEKKPELRAQLGTQGITGVKLIDLDFFDPKTSPMPELPFAPAENYIAAKPSFLTGVYASLEVVGDRLPELIDATVAALQKVTLILDDLHGAHIPERLVKAIDTVNGSAAELGSLLHHIDQARLPDKTAKAIESLDKSLAQVSGVLEGIGGDGGLVSSTQRAADSIGDLGRNTSESTADLDKTLRDLDEAALAIRELAESISRDPDMLVKGRASAKAP